jgi:hypothetical protein
VILEQNTSICALSRGWNIKSSIANQWKCSDDIPIINACEWNGVECYLDAVTDLHLDSSDISGTIASEIGKILFPYARTAYACHDGNVCVFLGGLQGLYVFTLSSNKLTGTIPTEIGMVC